MLELTVVDAGSTAQAWLRANGDLQVVRSRWNETVLRSDTIVLVRASQLASVGGVIQRARHEERLRSVLVQRDVDADMLLRVLGETERSWRDLLLSFTDPRLPQRVIHAWRIGAQHALIANAVALPERLLVTTCAMENVSVPWDALPALARLPVEERDQFEVEEFGSYLHWPAADVHLDVEALRVAVDPVLKAQAGARMRAHNERIGRAMRALREDAGLDQRAIVGLSERQVRRVEKGEVQPRLRTYEAFAAAHRLALQPYLDAVAAKAARG